MPGASSSSTPGPLITHIVETIADGVACLLNDGLLQVSPCVPHLHHWLIRRTLFWLLRLEELRTPTQASSIRSHLLAEPAEAPAQTLQAHGTALQNELQCDPCAALHPSTVTMLGRSIKNASRQYQRAAKRFGFSLNLCPDLKRFYLFIHCLVSQLSPVKLSNCWELGP